MSEAQTIATVHVGKDWRLMLADSALDAHDVLSPAGLAPDTFDGDGTRIPMDDLYRLWDILTELSDDPLLALKLGQMTSMEHFDPALFAAMCCPDMITAAKRLAGYKGLTSAFGLDVTDLGSAIRISVRCRCRPDLPRSMGLRDVVFIVNFARRATRSPVKPTKVVVPAGASLVADYADWFGCTITDGEVASVTLSAADANKPFLTRDDQMWGFLAPTICDQLQSVRNYASVREQVEQLLTELLPSGQTQIDDIARKLAVSNRSFQRRLADEGTTWQEVLNETRERMACHYLTSTELSVSEISFLIGFQDPSSLSRAFQRWTGVSPETWRLNAGQANG